MAGVLGAIEREHARADHPGGREPRVGHGEYRRVAHDAQRQVAAGDQPAAERGQPRHGLAPPGPGGRRVRGGRGGGQPRHGLALREPVERRMRVVLEVGESDRRPQREPAGHVLWLAGHTADATARDPGEFRAAGTANCGPRACARDPQLSAGGYWSADELTCWYPAGMVTSVWATLAAVGGSHCTSVTPEETVVPAEPPYVSVEPNTRTGR